MKKFIYVAVLTVCILTLSAVVSGCGMGEPRVVRTFEENVPGPGEDCAQAEGLTLMTYYEMSDGTWRTDDCTYQYRLVLTGSLGRGAVKDTTYIVLSNRDDITFMQACMASGLSSSLDAYFEVEDAVIVGMS